MGRELRRKQAKKEGKSLKREPLKEKNQMRKLIRIVLLLVTIVSIIYLTSAMFITKEVDWFSKKETNSDSTNTNTVSNSILASSIFKQAEEEYYVYFYDFDSTENSITTLVTNKLTNSKLYKVDTGSDLNKKYISSESNSNATNLSDLKVSPPTLIKITGDVITEYYEKDEITNHLS